MSSEITLDEELSDADALRSILWQIAEEAVDAARGKFGDDAIVRGRRFGAKLVRQEPSKPDCPARLRSRPPACIGGGRLFERLLPSWHLLIPTPLTF